MKRAIIIFICLAVTGLICFRLAKKINPNTAYEVGQPLDSLHGVLVYYNGGVDHVGERNLSEDHYNLGMKYQCVEFVKRYYYQHFHHKMPDSYGNAKDFFDKNIPDGGINQKRDLTQYTNPSQTKPAVSDLLIYDGNAVNPYGHVCIVSAVTDTDIEIIQQNPGPFAPSRVHFGITQSKEKWMISNSSIMGWLRKE